MQGKIIKGIAGFYYVYGEDENLYQCRARGIFRKEDQKPLVGDNVEIIVLDPLEKEGNLVQILPRKNSLIRPAVANIDQAFVIFAAAQPDPNFMLLDRFLITMEHAEIPVVICFNKKDLAEGEEMEKWRRIYEDCGYPVILSSALNRDGVEKIRGVLEGKTTVTAGPSGVGKSSLTNLLQQSIRMETGEISKKLRRGRHTTRHTQVIPINGRTFLMDTPGFTSLYLNGIAEGNLKDYFPEFRRCQEECRFQGCVHIHEPGCKVQKELEQGKISKMRYRNYLDLYNELKEKRRY